MREGKERNREWELKARRGGLKIEGMGRREKERGGRKIKTATDKLREGASKIEIDSKNATDK